MSTSCVAGGAVRCRRRQRPRVSGSRWRSSCGPSSSSTDEVARARFGRYDDSPTGFTGIPPEVTCMKRSLLLSLCCTIAIGFWFLPSPAAQGRTVGINVVLNTPLTSAIVADLSAHGNVLNRYDKLNAVTMRASEDQLAAIQGKPYVAAANPDAERTGSPVDPIAASDFGDGLKTWNMDSINVTNFGDSARTVTEDGSGVYVAVLDSGLLDS